MSVDAKMLSEYVRSFDDEMITMIIDLSKNIITLKTVSDTIKIKGLSGSEYVGIPEVVGSSQTISAL
ncbi:hypothetical protein KBB05_00250 [Patescibacteria group bacterium]|nr:hypothetical protein [Patescibacteria group bacterium]